MTKQLEFLNKKYIDGKRFYVFTKPNGKPISYPSVTTVLSEYNEEKISEIKRAIGDEKFAKISKRASERGTTMHKYLENYLEFCKDNGVSPDAWKYTMSQTPTDLLAESNLSDNLESYKTGKKMFRYFYISGHLEEFHHNIICCEQILYSRIYEYAGQTDFVFKGDDGTLHIGDFKTSTHYKTESDVEGYYMQLAAYITAYGEMTGEMPTKGVIYMVLENGDTLRFVLDKKNLDDYFKKFQNFNARFAERFFAGK